MPVLGLSIQWWEEHYLNFTGLMPRGTACIQAKFRRDSLKNNRKWCRIGIIFYFVPVLGLSIQWWEEHYLNFTGLMHEVLPIYKPSFAEIRWKITEKMMPNRHFFLFCARPWVINTMMGRTLPELLFCVRPFISRWNIQKQIVLLWYYHYHSYMVCIRRS